MNLNLLQRNFRNLLKPMKSAMPLWHYVIQHPKTSMRYLYQPAISHLLLFFLTLDFSCFSAFLVLMICGQLLQVNTLSQGKTQELRITKLLGLDGKVRVTHTDPTWEFYLVLFSFSYVYSGQNFIRVMMTLYQLSSAHEIFINTHTVIVFIEKQAYIIQIV